ncbi:MAG: hypothetical protein JWM90_186 [Thermoleophilia bacterium]|nr:hypothetical protein [Thermoleophilia bacterium]
MSPARVTPEQRAGVEAFVKRGYRLLPVDRATKRPRIKRYGQAASRNPQVLQQWAVSMPDCNFAALTRKQFAVLDVDPRHGGLQSFERQEQKLGKLPVTPKVMASGGGFHLYFEWCNAAVTSAWLAPGIDMRGEGGNGIIVIPGSTHNSGHVYGWATGLSFDDVPLAILPDAWQRWLMRGGDAAEDLDANDDVKSAPHATDATDAVKSTGLSSQKAKFALPAAITEGMRNETLYRYACSLRGLGGEYADIDATVLQANAERCQPALAGSGLAQLSGSVARLCAVFEPGCDVGRTRRMLREAEQWVAFMPVRRSVKQVILAHLRIAYAAGSLTYTASIRQLAEECGYWPNTVTAKNAMLVAEGLVDVDHGDRGWTEYDLNPQWVSGSRVLSTSSPTTTPIGDTAPRGITNVSVHTSCPRYTALVDAEVDRHLAFSGYSDLDFRVYATALSRPERRDDMAESLGISTHTLRGHLRALQRVGMVTVTRGVWTGFPVTQSDLDQIAADEGWAAEKDRRRQRFEKERQEFAELESRPQPWNIGLVPVPGTDHAFRWPFPHSSMDSATARCSVEDVAEGQP